MWFPLFLSYFFILSQQVHLGHGYLLSQWLSPCTNHRTDGHGGGVASVANRLKFPLRVLRAVRSAIGPHKAMFVKVLDRPGLFFFLCVKGPTPGACT